MNIEEQSEVLREATAQANAARDHYLNDIKEEESDMTEMTSNEKPKYGMAGTALGIGIGALAAAASQNGSGFLGGLFGNNSSNIQQELSNTKSELARVNAERYTDQSILTERDRHIEWAKQLASTDERLHAADEKIEKLATTNQANIEALRTEQTLQLQLAQKDSEIRSLRLENNLNSKIDAVANMSSTGIQQNTSALSNLA